MFVFSQLVIQDVTGFMDYPCSPGVQGAEARP